MISVRNAEAVSWGEVPLMAFEEWRAEVVDSVHAGARLSAMTALPGELLAVVEHPMSGTLSAARTRVGRDFASLTPDCPPAHLFEREIFEQTGVRPEGHPWLKPVRAAQEDFFRVEGEEIHEVAVGPVHAGVIEPGHFRFQCHGEVVQHLEIALGYQHRGVERTLVGGPDKRTIHYIETLAGDTTVGHATAYAQAVEALAGVAAPARADAIRGIALELERLANHTGDLGALAGDIGYLPTASYCGRLRGDFLNATALLCGSRFGRGLVRPGGVRFDAVDLRERLDLAASDLENAVGLLWRSATVRSRFENVGVVSRRTCDDLGLVGPAARACGVERDVRYEFPTGIFRFAQIPVSTLASGDVFARAYVRWLECQRSIEFIRDQTAALPAGEIRREVGALRPDRFVVSMVEGWRGEICHVARTDAAGRFASYKVVDPSFRNWTGLAMALRGQQISDFPLCNKSFNLSYCGHDL